MLEKIKNKTYGWLRWSEKYTKTDMVYLAQGGFWLNLGQLISSFSAFLLALAFANLISPETFGEYKYILSIAGMLSVFNLTGIGTALTKSVSQGYDGSLQPALKTKIKWGFLGGLICLGVGLYYYFIQNNPQIFWSLAITAIFLPLMDSFSLFSSYLAGKKEFKISAQYSIVSQIIYVALMALTLFLTKNVLIILSAYFLLNSLIRFACYQITLKKFKPNNEVDPETIKYGKHLSAINVLSTIAQYFDQIIVFHFLGSAQLAIYAYATAFPEHIRNFLKFIQTIALPKLAEKNKEESLRSVYQKTSQIAIFILIATLAYIITAPLLFKYLLPQYLASLHYSQVFALSLIYFVIALPISYLQAQAEHKKLYQFYTATSLFQIIILLPLIYFYGLWGVIVSRIIARYFQIFFLFYIIKK